MSAVVSNGLTDALGRDGDDEDGGEEGVDDPGRRWAQPPAALGQVIDAHNTPQTLVRDPYGVIRL